MGNQNQTPGMDAVLERVKQNPHLQAISQSNEPMWCARQKDFNDPHAFIERYLWIKTSKLGTQDDLVKFKLNGIQKIYAEMKEKEAKARGIKYPRFLVLKYRRGGITTYEQALSFWQACTKDRTNAVTIAQTQEDVKEIFGMVNRFYRHYDEGVRPRRTDASTELILPDLDSSFKLSMAGARGQMRGRTLTRVHGSEIPQWPITAPEMEQFVVSIVRAAEYGEVVFEFTARGAGGWAYETWNEAVRGGNSWIPIFLAWYMDPDNVIPLEDGEVLKLTEEEEDVSGRYNLTPEQIKFRRWIERDTGNLRPQEYPENPEEAWLAQGQSFFNMQVLSELMRNARAPLSDDGEVVTWHPPEDGMSYVIGADTSEGTVHGDYSAAGVLDKEGRQCARLYGKWSPDVFGRKLADLGHRYNTAMLAPEANNHGHSTLNTLKNVLRYPRLFIHKNYDYRPGIEHQKGKLGWQTNQKTRPVMLDAVKCGVDDYLMEVNDRLFLQECTTFEQNTAGKYEARGGSHDDLVMAWAIAWRVRELAMPRKARIFS